MQGLFFSRINCTRRRREDKDKEHLSSAYGRSRGDPLKLQGFIQKKQFGGEEILTIHEIVLGY